MIAGAVAVGIILAVLIIKFWLWALVIMGILETIAGIIKVIDAVAAFVAPACRFIGRWFWPTVGTLVGAYICAVAAGVVAGYLP